MNVPLTIECVECGGPAGRMPGEPELGWEVDDVVVYTCRDCNHLMHLVLEADDLTHSGENH